MILQVLIVILAIYGVYVLLQGGLFWGIIILLFALLGWVALTQGPGRWY